MQSADVEKHFCVLYETSTDKKELVDEIVLFVYEEPSWERKRAAQGSVPGTSLCKMRTAPRKFDKYYLTDMDAAKIYYWSNEVGAHVFHPFWKEKDGIYQMDRQEAVERARNLAAEEGLHHKNDELETVLAELNHMNIHYTFAKSGYWHNADAWGGDWGSTELSLHYLKDSFSVGEYRVLKIVVSSHWEEEDAWKLVQNTILGGHWSLQQFDDFVQMLDTYDTRVNMYFVNSREEVGVKSIYMDGGKIHGQN